jgi:hypothetical protein
VDLSAPADGGAEAPLLALPPNGEGAGVLALATAYAVWFGVLYAGASRWTVHVAGQRPLAVVPHLASELAVPFVPAASWLYLSGPLILLLAPLVLRTRRTLAPLVAALAVETLAGAICFVLWPLRTAFPQRVATGAFWLADLLNLDYNAAPSLHVALALTVALVVGRGVSRPGRLAWLLWAAGVAAAALLIHEHHLFDLASGALLAVAADAAVARPLERALGNPVTRRAWQVELVAIRELWRFTRRHPRYLLAGLAIGALSRGRWQATRPLRVAVCLAQLVDDVLDGDRPHPAPIGFADGVERTLRGQLTASTGGWADTTPAGQAAAVLTPWLAEALAADGDHASDSLRALIATLVLDRRRLDAREAWPAARLAAHHTRTFSLSLDLLLDLGGARLRAQDVPELVAAFAWCSPVRDLVRDLERGLVNLPVEVLRRAGDLDATSPPATLLAAGPVAAWLAEQAASGRAALDRLAARLAAPDDRLAHDALGRRIVRTCQRALAAWARRHPAGWS